MCCSVRRIFCFVYFLRFEIYSLNVFYAEIDSVAIQIHPKILFLRPARKEPYQRGVIVDVSGWECSVQLVDSGNMFIKHITDLKPLLKKFPLADHPPVAYHCRCIGILKSQLSAEMNLNFRQFIRDRKFIARFKTTSEPYQVNLLCLRFFRLFIHVFVDRVVNMNMIIYMKMLVS